MENKGKRKMVGVQRRNGIVKRDRKMERNGKTFIGGKRRAAKGVGTILLKKEWEISPICVAAHL